MPVPSEKVPITLHVSKQARLKLAQRAAGRGSDLSSYLSEVVEELSKAPKSLEEISGPIYQRFLESGMTDDELGKALEREKHDACAARRDAESS